MTKVVRLLTVLQGDHAGSWMNVADFREYLDVIRADPVYADDVASLDKLEEVINAAIVTREVT